MSNRRTRPAIILAALLIIQAVAGCSAPATDRPAAPWPAGEPIVPAATEDPEVASAARAEQWSQALAAANPLRRTPVSTGPLRAFEKRDLGDGFLAGAQSRGYDGENTTIVVAEYDSNEAALARHRRRDPEERLQESGPNIAGATSVTVSTEPATDAGCPAETRSEPTDLSLRFVVTERVAVRLEQPCVPAARIDDELDRFADVGERVLTLAQDVAEEPTPAAWFDRAEQHHILSNGSWHQQQYVLADRRDDLDLSPLLPEPFQDTGVRLAFSAQDLVLVYADRPAARRAIKALDRPAAADDRRYAGPPQRRASAVADDQWCVDGYHPGERGSCWSLVGRYVVITDLPDSDDAPDESQLEALPR